MLSTGILTEGTRNGFHDVQVTMVTVRSVDVPAA